MVQRVQYCFRALQDRFQHLEKRQSTEHKNSTEHAEPLFIALTDHGSDVNILFLCWLCVLYFTGKSIRMPCYFQDFKAESSPVSPEADVEEGSTWHVRGPSRLYRLYDNCDVQYFCRVREEHLYLIFTSIKMHMYGKQSTFSHKEPLYLLSSFSRQNTSKFLSPSNHSFPPCSTTQDQNNR